MTATLPDTIRTRAYIDGQFVDAADGTSFSERGRACMRGTPGRATQAS